MLYRAFLIAVLASVATSAFAQSAGMGKPLGMVVGVESSEELRPEIQRKGEPLGLEVKLGEFLFDGDKLTAGGGTIKFQFCPDNSRQTLPPGSAIEVAADSFKVTMGEPADKTEAKFCELPDLSDLPPAALQHYGGSLARALAPDDAKPPAGERTPELEAELEPINLALGLNPSDVAAHIKKAVVLARHGLKAEAAQEYLKLVEKAPGTTQTRALVHEVFDETAPVREEGSATTYALVVGVSKYQNLSEDQQLLFAHADAQMFYQYLLSEAGGSVPKENIVLVTDELATKAGIDNALDSFIKARAGKNDHVVVFMAAHGVVDETGAFIVAHDSDPEDLATTGFPMAKVQALMEGEVEGVGRLSFFVDVCHAGTIGSINTNQINVVVNNILSGPDEILALMGSGPKEFSFESSLFGGGHGAFSYFLVNALCGKADEDDYVGDLDGITIVDEVVEYVRAQVRRATRRKQTPDIIVRMERDVVLATGSSCGFELEGFKPLSIEDIGGTRAISVPKGDPEEYLKQFEESLAKGNILPNAPSTAFTPLKKLKTSLAATREGREKYSILESRLRTALEDAGQQVLLRYLAGDDEPQTAENFLAGARYFKAAREELTPESRILLAKEKFCEGRAAIFSAEFDEDPSIALDPLEESIRIDPDGAYSFNGLGIAYLEMPEPDYTRATAAFQHALRLAPHWAYPRHNLAVTFGQIGRFNEAIAAYQEAIELAPHAGYLPYNLGLIFQRMNRNTESEAAYGQAIAKASNLREEIRSKHLGMANNALGYLKASTGKRRLAEEYYRAALSANPEFVEARHNLAALLYEQDHAASEAMELWRQNLADDADYLPSRLSLAKALASNGDAAGAIDNYREVVSRQPNYAAARLSLAELLLAQGNADESLEQLKKAQEVNPRHYAVFEGLGDIELARNNSSEAGEAYEMALRGAPDSKTKKRIKTKLKKLRS